VTGSTHITMGSGHCRARARANTLYVRDLDCLSQIETGHWAASSSPDHDFHRCTRVRVNTKPQPSAKPVSTTEGSLSEKPAREEPA
jgi:hypothetical protein